MTRFVRHSVELFKHSNVYYMARGSDERFESLSHHTSWPFAIRWQTSRRFVSLSTKRSLLLALYNSIMFLSCELDPREREAHGEGARSNERREHGWKRLGSLKYKNGGEGGRSKARASDRMKKFGLTTTSETGKRALAEHTTCLAAPHSITRFTVDLTLHTQHLFFL